VVLTDADLVARCRAGDPEAWRELVERYSRYVYAITRTFSLREHDAEDVFQDVFARAYERLDTLRDADSLRPWLAQLTRRLCIDKIRSGSREQPAEEEPEGVEDRVDELTEALAMREALDSLAANCQEILDRFFARDESYRTIAEALDLPAGTIASRISRCLARLRQRLEEMGAERRLDDR
jgi:RNA polymerase sigma-70 factor, ECF subfamily